MIFMQPVGYRDRSFGVWNDRIIKPGVFKRQWHFVCPPLDESSCEDEEDPLSVKKRVVVC